MKTPEMLRHAADLLEDSVVTQREAEVIELMAGYILRTLGYEDHAGQEADLLTSMLD